MNADENEPGYRHIIFKPMPVDEVNFVEYYNQTSYGEAGIHWGKTNNKFAMEVTVPVGCHATVYVPIDINRMVTATQGAVPVEKENGYHIFTVESGVYKFDVN